VTCVLCHNVGYLTPPAPFFNACVQ
jgi:hypothetical protein